MEEPEVMSPGSIMPPYPWLLDQDLNTEYTVAKLKVLKMLNTPYGNNYEETAIDQLEKQATKIAAALREQGVEQEDLEKKEIIALIAYLQRLGTDADPKKQSNN